METDGFTQDANLKELKEPAGTYRGEEYSRQQLQETLVLTNAWQIESS